MDRIAFYSRRAEQELLLARRSADPLVMKVHNRLAAAYLGYLPDEAQEVIRNRVREWNGQD